jgi:hypothetical protein
LVRFLVAGAPSSLLKAGVGCESLKAQLTNHSPSRAPAGLRSAAGMSVQRLQAMHQLEVQVGCAASKLLTCHHVAKAGLHSCLKWFLFLSYDSAGIQGFGCGTQMERARRAGKPLIISRLPSRGGTEAPNGACIQARICL